MWDILDVWAALAGAQRKVRLGEPVEQTSLTNLNAQ
jgi:hypothetical protein